MIRLLIKEPFEPGRGNCLRLPPNLPTLKRPNFYGQSCLIEELNCLGLAKAVGLSPGFESLNN